MQLKNNHDQRDQIVFAVFAGYFSPHIGGHERYIELLYQPIVESGHKVIVVTCNTEHAPTKETLNKMLVLRFDCWNILGGTYPIPKLNRNFFYILRELKALHPRVVNTHTRFFLSSLIGFFFGKIHRVPVIHTEHGTTHVESDHWYVKVLAWLYDHVVGYVLFRFSTVVTSISNASANFVKHIYNRSVHTFYNAVKIHQHQTFTQIRDDDSKKNKVQILFAGRLIYGKGVQDLVAAFKELKFSNAALIIVGEGNYEETLKRQCKGSKNIFFFGKRSYEETQNLIAKCDIFVNPSYAEGLPTSVLEAGLASRCVIASNVGSTSEIITHKKNGILVQKRDISELKRALTEIYYDRSKREKYGHELFKVVNQKFNMKIVSSKYLQLVKSIFQNV